MIINQFLPIESNTDIIPYEQGVNFIDYDGTIVKQWTVQDIQQATSLPSTPNHTQDKWNNKSVGLISDGWNWTLNEIKTYFTQFPNAMIYVGALYRTNDTNTRIFINLPEGKNTIALACGLNGRARINWGDGSSSSIYGTDRNRQFLTYHTYDISGEYLIELVYVNATCSLTTTLNYGGFITNGANNSEANRGANAVIKKIELGTKVTLGYGLCSNNFNLEAITIPSDFNILYDCSFYHCSSLKAVVLPRISSVAGSMFDGCVKLSKISLPYSVTSFSAAGFEEFNGVSKFLVPGTVNVIPQYGASYNTSFTEVRCLNVESLEYRGFYNCSNLYLFEGSQNLNSIGPGAFENCYDLQIIKLDNTSNLSIADDAFKNVPTSGAVLIPYDHYINIGINKPIKGYATFDYGEALPATIDGYSLTWYSNVMCTQEISVGNGKEIYCSYS